MPQKKTRKKKQEFFTRMNEVGVVGEGRLLKKMM